MSYSYLAVVISDVPIILKLVWPIGEGQTKMNGKKPTDAQISRASMDTTLLRLSRTYQQVVTCRVSWAVHWAGHSAIELLLRGSTWDHEPILLRPRPAKSQHRSLATKPILKLHCECRFQSFWYHGNIICQLFEPLSFVDYLITHYRAYSNVSLDWEVQATAWH